jgi:Na+/melibiose symporter-like transporter
MNVMVEEIPVDDRGTRTSGPLEPQAKKMRRSHETNCQDGAPVTTGLLVFRNKNVRLFLLSFMLARVGGWLTYIATLTMIEDQMRNEGTQSQSVISVLVACRFLPIVLLSPFGGVLADSRDRRRSMMRLAALVPCAPSCSSAP